MNHDIAENEITIHSLNIDWQLVAKQKLLLLEFLDSETPEEFADVWNNANGQDLIEGIVNLMDSLQDQAAEELGEEIIFGGSSE
jgi:hypothetical protein